MKKIVFTKKGKILLLILVLFSGFIFGSKLISAATTQYTAQQITEGRAKDLARENRYKYNNLSYFDKLLVSFRLKDPKKITPTPTPLPTITPQPSSVLSDQTILAIRAIVTSAKSIDNKDYLVESTSGFKIIYAPHPDAFFGVVLQKPISGNITNIRNWLISKGINSNDLCKVNISYISSLSDLSTREKSALGSGGC